jgi:hypothetical protein
MTTVNLIEVVRLYIDRMIEDCGKNMKAFVMDKETVCDTENSEVFHSYSFIKGIDC